MGKIFDEVDNSLSIRRNLATCQASNNINSYTMGSRGFPDQCVHMLET